MGTEREQPVKFQSDWEAEEEKCRERRASPVGVIGDNMSEM